MLCKRNFTVLMSAHINYVEHSKKGRTNHVPMDKIIRFFVIWFSILYVFCFSCRIFEMSNTSLNTSNTLNSSAKARSARSVDARSHTLSSFNWIFFEYFRTNENPQQEWVNCLLSKRLSVWTFQIHHFLYLDGTKNYVFLV